LAHGAQQNRFAHIAHADDGATFDVGNALHDVGDVLVSGKDFSCIEGSILHTGPFAP